MHTQNFNVQAARPTEELSSTRSDLSRAMSEVGILCVCVVAGDSSVDIATRLQAGRSGDRIPVESEITSLIQTDPGAPSAQPAVQHVPGRPRR